MLLAFDLDKTIVTDDYTLPATIEDAIFRARAGGHLITVLTGRPLAAALPYIEQLAITVPYSVNHGATVMAGDGSVLRRQRIPAPKVAILLERYWQLAKFEFCCMVDDDLYVRNPNDQLWNWAHTRNRRVCRLEPEQPPAADKIVFGANGATERLEREINDAHPDFVTYLWPDGYLEVTGAGADKGGALQLIAERLSVPRQEVVAFGDGLNDVTMLAWAGRGVAVGPHAHPDALMAAQEHIAAPEEDGVVTWLEANLEL